MPSNDDLLFAEYAVRGGFLTQEGVDESLGVQARMQEMGVRESLFNVLVKRGVLREADAALVARRAGLKSGREPIPGYTLEQRIGTGAMGSVYKAYQKGMKRHVAIKILRRDLTDDPRQVERMQREAELVGKLDHPNIVRGLDSGETGGLVWFVMELVDGQTLHERIKSTGPLSVDDAVSITRCIAEALEHAHEHGVVHRDVKPGNILINTEGIPRLSDYGLAKGETDDALTHVDATLGTPQYVAPEQAKNPRDADIRSDIYSLGATLYTMLTGTPPFTGESLTQILTRVLYERPTSLGELLPELPQQVVYLVERMMARDRAHRYATPTDLLRDLRAFEAGRLTVPKGFRGDMAEFVDTRRKWRTIGTIAGAVLVVGALLVGAEQWTSHQRTQERAIRAQNRYETLILQPGDPGTWDGETVTRMKDAWSAYLSEHPQSARAAEARTQLDRWRRQSEALDRQQDFERGFQREQAKAGKTDWVRVLDELRRLRGSLAGSPDTGIAGAKLDQRLADLLRDRDDDAEAELRRARNAAARATLEHGERVYRDAAGRLRSRFYGVQGAADVDTAETAAGDFRRAHMRLSQHFEEFVAVADAALLGARPHFWDLRDQLGRARDAAALDTELVELLGALPPEGERRRAVDDLHDAHLQRIEAAALRAWEDVSRESAQLLTERRYDEALARLREFGERAAPEALRQIVQQRVTDSADRRDEAAAHLRGATGETEAAFFDALDAAAYDRARAALDALAERAVKQPGLAAGAQELVDDGRLLLDRIEALAWAPLRGYLRRGGKFDRGFYLTKGSGQSGPSQKYGQPHLLRLVRDNAFEVFWREDSEREEYSLYDLHLETLGMYAGLNEPDPERALVKAALMVTRYPPPDHASKAQEASNHLAEVGRLLERAATERALARIASRLHTLRERLQSQIERGAAQAEEDAAQQYLDAQLDMKLGRFDEAERKLNELLNVSKRLRRTTFVTDRRAEIKSAHERASASHRTSGFAKQFPGATLLPGAGGTGELYFDFDNLAAAAASFTLDPAATEIGTRPLLPAALPSLLPVLPEFAVRHDGVLRWRPWDGDRARHPGQFPVLLDCPFEYRRTIEVSFTYRSDAPYFFMLSIGGMNAGILSAEDDLEGGRGVVVWFDGDLSRPDQAFSERNRFQYLAEREKLLDSKDAAGKYFGFEAGRCYRIRFVKDTRSMLYVDGRLVAVAPSKPQAPELANKIVLVSYTSGEVDELRVSGILDEDWLKKR